MSRGPRGGQRRWPQRFYRALLRFYSREFRARYGDEAARVFCEQYRDARARGLLPALALTLRTLVAVPWHGWAERREGAAASRNHSRRRHSATAPGGTMERLILDLRYATRSLRKAPTFSTSAILIVGLGLGAVTTIFSVVDSVLLRPLPYPHSERLVRVVLGNSAVPIPLYLEWRDRTASFDSWAAAWDESVDLTGSGEPARLESAQVTPGLLSLLGARPGAGRLLTEADFDPAASAVALLSHRLWRQRWAGRPDLIGQAITLDGEPVQVVGVLDDEFQGPEALELDDVDIYLPLKRSAPAYDERNFYILAVVARLKDGVTLGSARMELGALERALADEDAEHYATRADGEPIIRARTLKEATVGDIGSTLFMFLGAVAFMLIIACSNIANLFLARGRAATTRWPCASPSARAAGESWASCSPRPC